MKNINKFFSVGLLFVGGLLTGCIEDIPEREASPAGATKGAGAYFENIAFAQQYAPEDATIISINVHRADSVNAASVGLISTGGDNAFKDVPTNIDFPAGNGG